MGKYQYDAAKAYQLQKQHQTNKREESPKLCNNQDVNTPEKGGGDPPSDENTLVERTHSNQHNVLGEVVTPCRDQPDAGLDDLPIYWESPEAAKLFGFDYKDGEGDDVFDGLTSRVKILTEVLRSADGYKHIVSHSEENLLPEQIFTYLCHHVCFRCLPCYYFLVWVAVVGKTVSVAPLYFPLPCL